MNYKIIIGIVCFVSGLLWLCLAYINVYETDGYLSPVTTCSECDKKTYQNHLITLCGKNKCVRMRNCFISRALRSVRCPLLGWENAECKSHNRGPATWFGTFILLLISCISASFIFYSMKHKDGYNFIYPIILSILACSSLMGLLEVPFGGGKHMSKKGHLGFALVGYISMFLCILYTAKYYRGNNVVIYLLCIVFCMGVLLGGFSERSVDGGGYIHKEYVKSATDRKVTDIIFQLGENIPLIMYFTVILLVSY
jgi:hypothetical protein